MKEKLRLILRMLWIPILSLVLAGVVCALTMIVAYDRAEARVFQASRESATEQIALFHTALEGCVRVLDAYADIIPLDAPVAVYGDILAKIIENPYFQGVILCNASGDVNLVGSEVQVNFTEIIALHHAAETSDVSVTSNYDADGNAISNIFVLTVPIVQNGELSGYLHGLVGTEVFQDLLICELYDRQGYSFMVDTTGRIIIGTSHQSFLFEGKNIFIPIDQAHFKKPFSYGQLADDLRHGIDGKSIYSIANEVRYVEYKNTGINDWMLFNVIPGKVVISTIIPTMVTSLLISIFAIIFVLVIFYSVLDRNKKHQKKLERENAEFYAAIEQSGRKMFRYDIDHDTAYLYGSLLETNQGVACIREFHKTDYLIGKIASQSIVSFDNFFKQMNEGLLHGSCNVQIIDSLNSVRWLHLDYTLITPVIDSRQCIVTYYDNTELRKKEIAYEKWQNDLAVLIGESILFFEIDLTADRMENLVGSNPFAEVEQFSRFISQSSDRFIFVGHVQRFMDFFDPIRLLSLYTNDVSQDSVDCMSSLHGAFEWHRSTIYMTKDPFNDHVKAFVSVMDVQQEYEERQWSTLDSLCQVLNRTACIKMIDKELQAAKEGESFALFSIDLDHFKNVNDTKGHQTGDEALRKIASLIKESFDEDDIVGRIGGDEFIAFVKNNVTKKNVERKASRLVNSAQVWIEGILVTTSVGISMAEGPGVLFETLYQQADAALYQAKKHGRCDYVIWGDESEIHMLDSATVQSMILPFQSLMDTISGGIVIANYSNHLSIRYVSEGAHRLVGHYVDNTQNLEHTILSMVYEEDLPKLMNVFKTVARDGGIVEASYRVGPQGMEWRLLRGVRYSIESDGSATLIGFITDITDLKLSETQIQAAEERYRIAAELSSVTMWEVDLSTRALRFISGQSKIVSMPDSSFLHVPESMIESELFHPDSIETVRSLFSDMFEGRDDGQYVIKQCDLDGLYFWTKVSFRILRDPDGSLRRAIGIMEIQPNVEAKMRLFQQSLQLVEQVKPLNVGAIVLNLTSNEVVSSFLPLDFEIGSSDGFFEGFAHYLSQYPKQPEKIERWSCISFLDDYASGMERQFMEYRYGDAQGNERWMGVTVNLVRHPVSGDINFFGFFRDISFQHFLESKLTIAVNRSFFHSQYSRETLDAMFSVANNEMDNGKFCAVTVVEVRGADYLKESLSAENFQNIMFAFSQVCGVMATGEVVGTLWDETHVVLFRTDAASVSEQMQRLKQEHALIISVIKNIPQCEQLEFVFGFDVESKEDANFYMMLDKASMACNIAKRWPQEPIVSFNEIELGGSDALQSIIGMDNIPLDVLEQNKLYRGVIQQQAHQLRMSNRDTVSHLLNADSFYAQAQEILKANPDSRFTIYRWDIDGFKFINERLGTEGGDRLLKAIATAVLELLPSSCLSARLQADHFVVLMQDPEPGYELIFFEKLTQRIIQLMDMKVALHMGVYDIDDRNINVRSMCDRAMLALKSVKPSYTSSIGYFDDSLHQRFVEEQELDSEMDEALADGQFEVYFQPQVNYENGHLISAEALVRWKHPTKGLISPGIFIPLFEKNGRISELDAYVWERCCQYMKKWKSEPEKYLDIPISVNISRIDIYNPNLCENIMDLVQKYDLSPSMLNLEITESAYMQNPEQLIDVVKRLRSMGFVVEMDDFGSGYSSLNTLKDVPVDILKLDVKFLSRGESDERGGNILSSVIRMAHWLKLPVIAEGVETKSQADYLKSLGCLYMQGYHFYRPMPFEAFDRLLADSEVGKADKYQGVDLEGAAAFWDPSTQVTMLFNSFVGGAAIMEYANGTRAEIIRANDQFFEQLNTTREMYMDHYTLLSQRFHDHDYQIFVDMMERAIETGDEAECEILSLPIDMATRAGLWIHYRVRMLAKNGDVYLFYLALENIDERKRMEDELRMSKEVLQLSISQMGHIVCTYDIVNSTLHVPQAYADKHGTEQELVGHQACVQDIFDDDKPHAISFLNRIEAGVKEGELIYRTRCLDGSYTWERATFMTVFDREEKPVNALLTIEDASTYIEHEIENARTSLIVESNGMCVIDYDVATGTLYFKSNMEGRGPVSLTFENYLDHMDRNDSIMAPNAIPLVRDKIISVLQSAPCTGSYEFKANNWGKGFRWSRMDYVSLGDKSGKVYHVSGQITDIQLQKDNEELLRKLNTALSKTHKQIQHMTVTERIFMLLYDTDVTSSVLDVVLQVLGEQYDLSRVYIFEDTADHTECDNTFEWCAPGIDPEIANLQHVSYAKDLGMAYHDNFDENGVFFCRDIDDLPDDQREFLQVQGIQSMLQCSLHDGSEFIGFIGYDECRGHRQWTEEQISTLSMVSRVIGAFLVRLRSEERNGFSGDFRTALDNNAQYIYIIDPDTYVIQYVNNTIRNDFGSDFDGKICHQEFMGRDCPCENCPMKSLRETGRSGSSTLKRPDGLHFISQASQLNWYGKDLCMISCLDITEWEV